MPDSGSSDGAAAVTWDSLRHHDGPASGAGTSQHAAPAAVCCIRPGHGPGHCLPRGSTSTELPHRESRLTITNTAGPTKGPAAVRTRSEPPAHTKSPFCAIRCRSALADHGTQITAICACRGADHRSMRAANSRRSGATGLRTEFTLRGQHSTGDRAQLASAQVADGGSDSGAIRQDRLARSSGTWRYSSVGKRFAVPTDPGGPCRQMPATRCPVHAAVSSVPRGPHPRPDPP